jgi:hypothetical protein
MYGAGVLAVKVDTTLGYVALVAVLTVFGFSKWLIEFATNPPIVTCVGVEGLKVRVNIWFIPVVPLVSLVLLAI